MAITIPTPSSVLNAKSSSTASMSHLRCSSTQRACPPRGRTFNVAAHFKRGSAFEVCAPEVHMRGLLLIILLAVAAYFAYSYWGGSAPFHPATQTVGTTGTIDAQK